jgi:hypothetical protein
MPRATKPVLSPDICGSQVILFLGAGASAALGFRLMGSFMDLLESNVPGPLLPVLKNIYEGPRGGKDLELVFEAIEGYDNMQDCCEREPNWRGAVDRRLAHIRQMVQQCHDIRNRAEDLVIRHYSGVEADKVVPHYEGFLTLLTESNPSRFLPVFTTNYDTAIEDFVDNAIAKFRIVDGFEGGLRRYWAPDSAYHAYRAEGPGRRTIVLFKLHGSSTWYRHKHTGRITNVGSMSLRLRDDPQYENVLVWPARTKQIQEGPHQLTYQYLKECLSRAHLCMVIGFSFRDEVIRRYFEEALISNRDLTLVVVDPEADNIISRRLSIPPGIYKKGAHSEMRKVKPPAVFGVPFKYGPTEFSEIARGLSRVDFSWELELLEALGGRAAAGPTKKARGTDTGTESSG